MEAEKASDYDRSMSNITEGGGRAQSAKVPDAQMLVSLLYAFPQQRTYGVVHTCTSLMPQEKEA